MSRSENRPTLAPTGGASSSVPSPMSPASGMSETDAEKKTHADPSARNSNAHETGAATMEHVERRSENRAQHLGRGLYGQRNCLASSIA